MYDIEGLFNDPRSFSSFLVAEIGINHDGDVRKAEKLIAEAARQGADAVKFQVFRTEAFLHPQKSGSARELFQSYQLSYRDFEMLRDCAAGHDLIFFATPLDRDSLQFMLDLKSPLVKIASSDINTEPFLEWLSGKDIRVILSTGMADEPEIQRALDFFPASHAALLYCVSEYPAQPQHFDLNILTAWQKKWGRLTGFSDHSLGMHLSVAAVALGARIIERHFTLDRNLPGADHAMSLEATAFGEMCRQIRELESALGPGEKQISEFEHSIRPLARRSLYLGRAVKKDEIISEEDLVCMRPGPGVSLDHYRDWTGRKAEKDFALYEEI